jgi:uncharacterized membrane protein YkoI
MRLMTSLFVVSALFVAPSAYADDDNDPDDNMKLEDLPKAARDTVMRELEDGKITEIDREDERGRKYFEVEFTQNNRRYEIHVAEDGKLLRRKDD